MMTPVLAAQRFAWAGLLGAVLALGYEFLRPIRPRALADLLFFPFLIYIWCVLSFRICRGDIRMGITLGLAAGFFLWDKTAGRVLRRVFQGFWQCVFRAFAGIFHSILKISKKIWNFRKFFLASRKKSGTI